MNVLKGNITSVPILSILSYYELSLTHVLILKHNEMDWGREKKVNVNKFSFFYLDSGIGTRVCRGIYSVSIYWRVPWDQRYRVVL